jgi:hypothetical protein
VHTDIEAPYKLDIQGLGQLETGRGVAYSAELVHPELGVVGRIANEGCGGPTMFHTYDRKKFAQRDLELFVEKCRLAGEPMETGFAGVETLLEDVITEAECAENEALMRKEGLFLVRSHTKRSWGIHRGPVLAFTKVVFDREGREALGTTLAAEPENRLAVGESWQFFTGEEWRPLLPETTLTGEQVTARVQALVALYDADAGQRKFIQAAGPVDGLYVTGTKQTGRFTLLSDHSLGTVSNAWCPCRRRLAKPVRFERWCTRRGLIGSGTLHGAKSCRRLLTLD